MIEQSHLRIYFTCIIVICFINSRKSTDTNISKLDYSSKSKKVDIWCSPTTIVPDQITIKHSWNGVYKKHCQFKNSTFPHVLWINVSHHSFTVNQPNTFSTHNPRKGLIRRWAISIPLSSFPFEVQGKLYSAIKIDVQKTPKNNTITQVFTKTDLMSQVIWFKGNLQTCMISLTSTKDFPRSGFLGFN